jgi:hypothetical protein
MEVLGLWSRSHEAHGLVMVVGFVLSQDHEVLGLWSRSHEAHGLVMVVGLNRGLCRQWWVFGVGVDVSQPCDCGFEMDKMYVL